MQVAPDLYELADMALTQEMEEMAENRELCIADGEHMKRIISEGGYDVCYNCGAEY